MAKRVLFAGLSAGLVLILWTFVLNGIFGFRSRIDMNRIPDDSRIYAELKHSIVAPGSYVVNPEVVPNVGFPHGQPVYSVRYSGFGHEAAGRIQLVQLAIAVLGPTIAAWLLSLTSDRVLSRYSRRVLFFAMIGLLVALVSDLPKFDIGGYPLRSVLLLCANDVISWTLCGVVAAWPMHRIVGTPIQPRAV